MAHSNKQENNSLLKTLLYEVGGLVRNVLSSAFRILRLCWDVQLQVLKAIGLLPVLQRRPWLFVALAIVLLFTVFPLGLFFTVTGLAASVPSSGNKSGIRAGSSRSNEKGWVRNFIIFFVANELEYKHDPRSAKEFLTRLCSSQLCFSDEQSLLVWLKAYLHKIEEPPLQPADLASVVKMMPNVLEFELAGFNSPSAVRSYLIQQNKLEGDKTMSPEELETACTKIVTGMRASEDDAQWFEFILLRFRLNKSFQKKHHTELSIFSENMLENYVEPMSL